MSGNFIQGRSVEDLIRHQQEQRQVEIEKQKAREKLYDEQREKARQKYLERNRIYERVAPLSSTNPSAGAAGGSNIYEEYISQTDTIWLYPQADLDTYISTYTITGNTYQTAPGLSPSVTFTKNGNVLSFPTVQQIVTFFSGVYLVTELSQPVGNPGFSCGVGTRTRAKKQDRIILQLDSGIKVVEWALMTQLTNQSELPVGGDSPVGTVGWANIYCDWDTDGIQDPNSSAAAGYSNLIDGLVFARIG